jgi:hypothetical protein
MLGTEYNSGTRLKFPGANLVSRHWFAPLFALILAVAPTFADDKPKDEKPKSGSNKKLIKLQGYTTVMVQGFTVFVSDESKSHEDDEKYQRKPMEVLELELKGIARVMPPKMLKILQTVKVFAEWEDPESKPKDGKPGVVVARYWYDSGRGLGMAMNGRDPRKANNIEILTMRHLTEKWQPGKTSEQIILLHELCHAVHAHLLDNKNPHIIAAYNQAMERGLYASVKHESGRELKAYASTNDHEYFAELSCSYLDRCAYFPFTREDLKEYDRAGYDLMAKVWGNTDPRSTQAKRSMKGDSKPVTKTTPKDDEKPAAKPPAKSKDDAAAAQNTLDLIEALIRANKKDSAREKLKEFIAQHDGTEAAKKAKKMLEDLK